MYKPSDITLYIPFFNAQSTITACLDAVFGQSIKPAEIVVVDDGSDCPFINDNITVIRFDKNRGLAAARNAALKHCNTPLMAALDSDVKPDPSWLMELLETLNSGNYAGAGGMMIEAFTETIGDKWRSIHMAQHWGDTKIENPRFLYGSNTLFKSETLESAGGYDENYKTNDEDRFISEILYSSGHSLCYTPDAVCRHLRRDTARTIIHGYWRWHHMKGVKRGDFSSSAGIIKRVKDVNFGIANYRTALDLKENRHHLLALDAAIPWVFCTRDIIQFSLTTGAPVFTLPFDELSQDFCEPAKVTLRRILDISRAATPASQPDWFREYISAFRQNFKEYLAYTGFNPYKKEELWLAVCNEATQAETKQKDYAQQP